MIGDFLIRLQILCTYNSFSGFGRWEWRVQETRKAYWHVTSSTLVSCNQAMSLTVLSRLFKHFTALFWMCVYICSCTDSMWKKFVMAL